MYFVYALIVLFILIISLINIEPYKKKMLSKCPPTDLMFLSQLSLTYIAILGREYSSLYIYQYFHTLWVIASLGVGLFQLLILAISLVCGCSQEESGLYANKNHFIMVRSCSHLAILTFYAQ